MPTISPLATVERGAKLADDVQVGPFAYIGKNVRIGPGCVIDNNATVTGKTTLGAKNHVYPLAVIGIPPEGTDKDGKCVIGEANSFREHVTVYAGQKRPTEIGSDNLIMIASQIGASATVGDHGIFANCTQIAAGASVANYVVTSTFTVVEPNVTVGAYTLITPYTAVTCAAPPYAIVQGLPFRVRGLHAEKLRRCGFGEDDVRMLKRAFRDIFNDTKAPDRPHMPADDSAEYMKNPHVLQLIAFLKQHVPTPAEPTHG